MGKIMCLLGCSWELLPGSVFMGSQELFTWKCSKCGANRSSPSDTDPKEKVA